MPTIVLKNGNEWVRINDEGGNVLGEAEWQPISVEKPDLRSLNESCARLSPSDEEETPATTRIGKQGGGDDAAGLGSGAAGITTTDGSTGGGGGESEGGASGGEGTLSAFETEIAGVVKQLEGDICRKQRSRVAATSWTMQKRQQRQRLI